jgi:purine-nucleoside phosphorylase
MKEAMIDLPALMHAANSVKTKWSKAQPFASLVLGSGWGDVISAFDVVDELPYEKIWGLGKGGVVGHASKLTLAEINHKKFFIFQGRRHWYEGEGWTPVVTPVYISQHCGASIFFATNAAGGISYPPGSLMMLTDHINYLFDHPLIGPHNEEFGERFPDQSEVYSVELREKIKEAAKDVEIKMNEGVYLASTGPTYETPAEIHAYKTLGANAVGMSTVPEAILANAMGLKVAAISCISNHAAGISKVPLSHQEVIDTMDSIMPEMVKLIPKIVEKFSQS